MPEPPRKDSILGETLRQNAIDYSREVVIALRERDDQTALMYAGWVVTQICALDGRTEVIIELSELMKKHFGGPADDPG